jgi:hypothetical protein
MSSEIKKCTQCKKEKHITEFNLKGDKKKCKTGRRSYCKVCSKAYWLAHKFNITLKDYDKMLSNQNNKCGICQTSFNSIDKRTGNQRAFAVDHDHKSNEIRGLLCSKCNIGLGLLGDTLEDLHKAVKYLESK